MNDSLTLYGAYQIEQGIYEKLKRLFDDRILEMEESECKYWLNAIKEQRKSADTAWKKWHECLIHEMETELGIN